ncbi:MAG: TetR/AcrR family transcriptional regulator [Acidaminobacteraceae bacterium]
MKKKELIRINGKQLFIEQGFKKTNIAGIMNNVKMATGTFYNYYESKDQLFMDIYLEENTNLKQSILDKVDISGHPLQVMGQLMTLNHQGMLENPILKEWYNKEVFSKIEKVYREANGVDSSDFMYDSFVDVVKSWQEQGTFRSDISAEMIMAIFSAIINIDTHKEEVGLSYFPELLSHINKFVINGLME